MAEPVPVEGIDVLGNGLLRLVVLQPGDQSKPCPGKGDVAQVEVVKVLVEDQDYPAGGVRSFRLGDGDECDALELVVPRMRPKELAAIRSVPAAFGLDKSLCQAKPSAEVKAVVRLLKVDTSRPVAELSLQERAAEARKKRERGKLLFGREEFRAAGYSFSLGVSYIADSCHAHAAKREGCPKFASSDSQEDVPEEVLSLCGALYTNLALMQLKAASLPAIKDSTEGSALETCRAALSLDTKNAKAWYLKGKAHMAADPLSEQDRTDAIAALDYALELEPQNKVIKKLLARAREAGGLNAYSFMDSRWYQWMVTGLLLATMPICFRMVTGDFKAFMRFLSNETVVDDSVAEGMLASNPSLEGL